MRCSVLLQCVAVCCNALQFVSVRCSALQCVAARGSAAGLEVAHPKRMSPCVLQCVAVCCSVLQCVAESLYIQCNYSILCLFLDI